VWYCWRYLDKQFPLHNFVALHFLILRYWISHGKLFKQTFIESFQYDASMVVSNYAFSCVETIIIHILICAFCACCTNCKVHEINEQWKCHMLVICCVSMIIEWILVKFSSGILTWKDAIHISVGLLHFCVVSLREVWIFLYKNIIVQKKNDTAMSCRSYENW